MSRLVTETYILVDYRNKTQDFSFNTYITLIINYEPGEKPCTYGAYIFSAQMWPHILGVAVCVWTPHCRPPVSIASQALPVPEAAGPV